MHAARFSIVTARYAFHHLLDPFAALREMAWVCAPHGRILVVDAYAPEDPYLAELQAGMDDPIIDGHPSEKMVR